MFFGGNEVFMILLHLTYSRIVQLLELLALCDRLLTSETALTAGGRQAQPGQKNFVFHPKKGRAPSPPSLFRGNQPPLFNLNQDYSVKPPSKRLARLTSLLAFSASVASAATAALI